jgi:hypothetical protein
LRQSFAPALVEREVEVVRHCARLIACDQSRDGDEAAIARRQTRTLPQIADDRDLPVFLERRREVPEVVGGRAGEPYWSVAEVFT